MRSSWMSDCRTSAVSMSAASSGSGLDGCRSSCLLPGRPSPIWCAAWMPAPTTMSPSRLSSMPLSNQRVFKPCCGTGSSSDQAEGECQPRISIVRWSVADDSRLRSSAHDPERPSEVVAERGCPGANSIHPGNSRIEELNNRHGRDLRLVLSRPEQFLQHNHL